MGRPMRPDACSLLRLSYAYTLSPVLGFIVYITSIQRSKAASPVVSKVLIASDGYLIDRHPIKRSLFAAGAIGYPSATQQDSGRPGTAPW